MDLLFFFFKRLPWTVVLLLFALNAVASDNLAEKAVSEYKAENFEEAMQLLKEAEKQQPASSLVPYYMGLTYIETGNLAEAAKSFKDAVKRSPPVPDAYAQLIEVLYNLNKLGEARSWIVKAEGKGFKLPQVIFMKGLILSKEEEDSKALSAFKEAKAMDKSLTQACDFQIAMIYARESKISEAKKVLKAVIAADPSSEISAFAKEYEKAIRGLKSYRPWKFLVGVAYQYDDNVVLEPSEAVPGVTITGAEDSGIVGTFRIDYAPILSGKWFFNGQFNFYSDTYFHTHSHSVIAPTITLSPGYNFRAGAVSLPLLYSYVWLGESGYESVFSVRPTYTRIFSPGNIGQFSAGYTGRNFIEPSVDPDEDRDGDIYSAAAAYIHTFADGEGIINVMYGFSRDIASGKDWTNTGHRIDASILVPLSKSVSLVAAAEAFLQDYSFVNSVFGVKRRDRTYWGSANIIWQFSGRFDLNVQYSHTTADSNISLYEYNRNIYTAGVEYRY